MLDFLKIRQSETKGKGKGITLWPDFVVESNGDVMIRGHSFYGVWDEKKGLWSTNEYDLIRLVDEQLAETAKAASETFNDIPIKVMYLNEFSSKMWTSWINYVKNAPDNFHPFDSRIIFSNSEVKKEDYCTKRLPYPIKEGDHKAYDELMSTLYEPSERDKLEWAIGAIISGDSKEIQKFIVLYGEAGTGKSTVIHIIEQLFPGYCTNFDAKALGNSSNSFSLEPFRMNPLVAIQHDGDLSRIEDNTKLNSIVSHENLVINEKHKAQYSMRLHSFLFMGSNKPVKITEARSGILRRLIDVTPSGRRIPFNRYESLVGQIQFELGAIAYHCLNRYQQMGKAYYDKYKPTLMFGATNDFYNFVSDNYDFFAAEEGVTLSAAWELYKRYADLANFQVRCSMRVFKEELKSYFNEYRERIDGRYKVYLGLKKDKFDYISVKEEEEESGVNGCEFVLKLDCDESPFDKEYGDCPAQLAKEDETPDISWSNVKTKLKDIDTKKLHYAFVPEDLIVIDFDLKDAEGNKDPVANLIAASKWPPTYAEFSKSGGGIHLHYIFDGDVLTLSRVIEPGIEVKVFKKLDGTRGFASLRRKLTKCNNLPIAHISPGPALPLRKGANELIKFEGLKNEKAIRTLILRSLKKEHHGHTAPEVDLIFKTLDDAYNNGVTYDVTDLRNAVLTFASKSTNQSAHCIEQVAKMHFKSKSEFKSDPSLDVIPGVFPKGMSDEEKEKIFDSLMNDGNYIPKKDDLRSDAPIVFFDVEVFINLLVICWKFRGAPVEQTVKMINPTPEEVKKLFKYRLIGFNNRRYDNHILYAASLGYSNTKIYEISHGMINSDKKEGRQYTFGAAYSLSYTDIYDFAAKKQSLKKWEIELGIHHQELGLPWDQPAPEELWGKVADYCVNDVIATEALFENLEMDFETRKLLASLSGLSVNDPNRAHITRILVGDEKNPELVYTDLSKTFPGYEFVEETVNGAYVKHNMYRGIDLGFGGYVFSKPGMYVNVALLDVGNMHGASIVALNKFGEHTKNYIAIREARMAIKAGRFEEARGMLGGKLAPLIDEIENMTEGSDEQLKAIEGLQTALKLILNSTYGIAAATFDNPLRDKRDKNNIIALRGALFMKTLQDEVTSKGFEVIHIKTDSIKIPNATDEIINYILEFGRRYGYEFEHECTYEKMCLVNDAVYIAKYDDKGIRNKHGKHAGEWSATGAQFQQPYVFKELFSKKPIEHNDVCETKETSKGIGLYLDLNESLPEGEHNYQFVGKVGQFCPVKSGIGGGILVRENNGKFDAVTGTKKASYDKAAGEEPVYRWLESEVVSAKDLWDCVDTSYYKHLVDEAVNDISKYGDFEWFSSDDPVPKVGQQPLPDFMNIPEDAPEEIPFLTA